MTASRLLFRCSGCGAETSPSREAPLPFVCPKVVAGDGVDHVLARAFPADAALRPGTEDDPFLRYRALSAAHALATREGMTDATFVAAVERVERGIAAVDGGRGFVVTPLVRAGALAREIAPGLELWVKDETGNVSGSHKARHLMGILLYLEVAREVGLLTGPPPRLAIASCGNAALAAAVVARAGGLALEVFIPPDANARVVERLRALGAAIVVCPRTDRSPPGDPCVHAFRAAVAGGALPFCCQGSDNGLTIDGGQTLAYELAERAHHRVEAFQVTDLQDQAARRGDLDERLGLGHRRGQGLLHQRVHAGAQAVVGDGEVTRGRHHDGDQVDLGEDGAVIGDGLGAVLGSDLGAARSVGVDHRVEFHAVELAILLGVEIAEVTDPDHRGTQCWHTLTRAAGAAPGRRFRG